MKMVTAPHDACPVPREDALQSSQPSRFDCNILVANDRNRCTRVIAALLVGEHAYLLALSVV
ncbi:MAG TPA: hypothetical protein VE843_11280, partial [Ktedonobacteraceae bacterium]|nr:hypothetical protein [Ktedonobacteraceae bacterium]